jgi:HK97 family phage prohead protease
MEHKHLQLEFKAGSDGTVEGYGAVFGSVDLGGDIIMPGAFTGSLKSGRKIKMLWQHDPDEVIGVWDDVKEDGNGLRVKGRFLTSIAKGAEAYELAKADAVDGLSIGYQTMLSEQDGKGNRLLKELNLWEVSFVTFPMNELARVDAVKAAEMTERDLERMLTRDAGLSRSVARALMGGGLNAVKAMRDAGNGSDELAALLKARISL